MKRCEPEDAASAPVFGVVRAAGGLPGFGASPTILSADAHSGLWAKYVVLLSPSTETAAQYMLWVRVPSPANQPPN